MVKDANKPKGRTSAYAFFVLYCREEHKKKSPGTSVNFAKFSKTCSERWKVCVGLCDAFVAVSVYAWFGG